MSATAAARPCPVCGASPSGAPVFVEGTLDPARLDGFSFASRKIPEFMSHRMVRCRSCDLVFVDRPPGQEELGRAYHQARYDSSEEAEDAALTYAAAIAPILAGLPRRGSALEIGAGTGAFLEHLQRAGFDTLCGIEPSAAAIEAAPLHRRAWLREAIFDEAVHAPQSFDLVCCFMTMEHVLDPGALARAVWRLLRPGGAFVIVTHDYRSMVNRLMGRRSPIVDVEHMQLFSAASARHLFEACGFRHIGQRPLVNRYALKYWVRLLPLPASIKPRIATAAAGQRLGQVRIGLNVGNLFTSGIRPA